MCVGGVCAVLIGIALVWILRSGPAIGMNRVPLFIDNHALTVCYRQVAQQIPMLITSAISYQIPSEARRLSNLPYAIISLSNETCRLQVLTFAMFRSTNVFFHFETAEMQSWLRGSRFFLSSFAGRCCLAACRSALLSVGCFLSRFSTFACDCRFLRGCTAVSGHKNPPSLIRGGNYSATLCGV